MALEFTDGIQNVNPVPENRRYYNQAGNLYTSTAQAISEITAALRWKGLTVAIDDGSGSAVEYWWKNGTADGDLILKGSELLDEDDFASDSSTKAPTQQSTKAYVDNGDNKLSQIFSNIADADFIINFNSEDFTINRHVTALTANRTCTVSNEIPGSQFVIDISIASGEVDHELIFSGPVTPTIIPDYINGTSDGVKFPGNASAATKYTVIGWFNGTQWRINVIDWN